MSTPWISQYCRSDDATPIAERLREQLAALGYTLYNPFGAIPGKTYPQSVRLFVTPSVDGWVRLIGTPDVKVLPHLADFCLALALDENSAHIAVYSGGTEVSDKAAALAAFLRPGQTLDDLQSALNGDAKMAKISSLETNALPMDALPDDVKAMAGGVNPAQAQKMFSRLTGDLMKKVTKDASQADAARALVSGSNALDWNSAGGMQIRALAACLSLPNNWREPDFTALRDAYQLHERLRRNPNARQYPGDAETMAKVPDALDYVPVYGGMN